MSVFSVGSIDDIGAARRGVRQLAQKIGFDDAAIAELDIVVTELATNLAVHHTIDGKIVAREVCDHLGRGLEIVAQDRGPGIANVKLAVKDHHSAGGSLGCGLGAVRRLVDEFDVYSHVPPSLEKFHNVQSEPCGTIVMVRKWLMPQTPGRFIYSANSRPLPGEIANGDGLLVTEERDGLFVAVADGLGHGPEAAAVTGMAIEFIGENHRMELDRMLIETHEILRKTRGAALTLVRICLSDRTLIHTGVGNVEARVYPRSESSLIPRPGVLGYGTAPRPKTMRVPWPADGLLIVFSDGISGRWDMDETLDLRNKHVTVLSHMLMREHARPKDDATVVVAREVST